jgi:hypothetical protein
MRFRLARSWLSSRNVSSDHQGLQASPPTTPERVGLARNLFGTKVIAESSVSVSEFRGLRGDFAGLPVCLPEEATFRPSGCDLFDPVAAGVNPFKFSLLLSHPLEKRKNASSIQSPKSSMTALASLIKVGI